MLGARTLRAIRLRAKAAAFSAFGLQELLDEQEALQLATAMGFVGQFEEHRRFQFEYIKGGGLKPSDRVLEIGFGPLTLGIPLIRYLAPGGYTGVDIRASVADLACAQIAKHKLSEKNPRLIVANDFGKRALEGERFDRVWSFSVLFHLTDALVDQLFDMVSSALAVDGRFFALINVSLEESRWLEFPFVRREAAFYRELASRRGLAMRDLGAVSRLGFRRSAPDADHVLLEFARG